ncbi:flavodoxin family protein [Virgibacillus ndiopensis]|uniref:flavodoxin family protein n=1 Tax=Virgibacillus ndiopensis TaxID=2004408 RepID=UPI000C06AA78|nr:flavodoxin family protein [Virgibacillus ndiopensis]
MGIAVIYGGNRSNGNTEILTERAIKDLADDKIYLKDYTIQAIEDMRHSEEGFQEVNDDFKALIDRMLAHDTLVFSTPIYWYSMTGTMKNFIDRWSQIMRDPGYLDFKNQMSAKRGYVITVGGDDPYIKGLPLIQQFQHIFDFVTLPFVGYILGKGNKPGEIYQDAQAIFAAVELQKNLKAGQGGSPRIPRQ